MASVDWKKLQKGSIAGIVGHATRHDGKDVDYSNKDIDKSKISEDYTIGGFPKTSKSIKRFLSKRVEKLDEIKPPKRVRKDRVVATSFIVYGPAELDESQQREFFKMAYEEVAKTCGGKENLAVGQVHVDEKHPYRDAMSGEWVESLNHMHVVGIPWTEEHGVNGKYFMTRERMKDLNRRIDTRCYEMFKIHYLKGEAERVGRDVLDLKRDSMNKDLESIKKSLREVNTQIEEQKAYLGELGRYRAMETWLGNQYYKQKETGEKIPFLDVFEDRYKEALQQIEAEKKPRDNDIER